MEPLGGRDMQIREDPENNETRALLNLVDFSGADVLEIGCGDGRLTYRYAEEVAKHYLYSCL